VIGRRVRMAGGRFALVSANATLGTIAALAMAAALVATDAPRAAAAAAPANVAAPATAAPPSRAQTRVLESTSERVLLEVLVPPPRLTSIRADGERFTRLAIEGAAPWGTAGEPGVVRIPVIVAIPAGTRPTVRVVEAQSTTIEDCLLYPTPAETILAVGEIPTSVERFRWDRARYLEGGEFPEVGARVASVSRARFQDVAAIEVYPVRSRAAAREAVVASRIVIEVRFASGAKSAAPRAMESAPADARWETVYKGLIPNAEASRALRVRPARDARLDAGPRKAGARAGSNPEWKLSVIETGLYRIAYETLAARGLPLDVATSELRIFQRSVTDSLVWAGVDPFRAVEIPIDVVDADEDGAFGPGDAVHAYLRDFRDQFMPGDYEDVYTNRAIYFLTVTPAETGARMSETAGWLGIPGLAPPASFPSTVHYEPDVLYNNDPPSGTIDLWFAVDYLAPSATMSLDLPDVDPAERFRFRAQAVGRSPDFTADNPHRLFFAMNGTPFASFSFTGRPRVTYRPDSTFAGTLLSEGQNAVVYTGNRGDDPLPASGAYLDWIEVEYGRLYRARGSRLAFGSGDALGPSEFHVGGFGGSDVYLYDVTDPLSPIRVRADSLVSVGGVTELRFQAQVVSPRRYEAATAAGARAFPDSLLALDASSSLATDEADYVMIAYDDFAPALAPLVAHRQSQGMRVKVAKLSDVYDEFNGGLPSPDAIRRYMKYALTWWDAPPAYLLLVGDGSEDHRRHLARNDVDFVPSKPFFEQNLLISGDHWDASDFWYVLLDGATDSFQDVLVGRFSVGSLGETAVQAAKTVAYENGNYAEDWRRKYLLIADDPWTVESLYQNSFQSQFRSTSDTLGARILRGSPISLDTCHIWMSDYTDRFRLACDDDPLNPPGNPTAMAVEGFGRKGNICVVDSVRAILTPWLFDRMNQGVLFANFQGHGNRWVLSHESIMLDGYNHIPSGYFGNDIARYEPTGRPNIFMAFGCSISEFERLNPLGTFDDCLTEKMMNVPNGGAVATIGSTGIEYLNPNLYLNEELVFALIAGGEGDPPRLLLGEINSIGMGRYAALRGQRDSMLRYVLFGDPALRLAPLPASFTVRVDGVEAVDGDYIGGHEDGSPVRIVVTSPDPGVLASLRIARRNVGAEEQPIDPSEYPVAGDSAVYAHEVEFASYDLLVRGPAVGGGGRTVTLKVGFDARFTFGGRDVPDGTLVDAASEIVILLSTSLNIAGSDIDVRLDDVPLEGVARLPEGPRAWRLELPALSLTDGTHELELRIKSLSTRRRFEVRNAFQVYAPLNFPNPFDPSLGDSKTTFSFRLTGDADEVEIGIYTVNGRKIREIRLLSAYAGYNPSGGMWDGTWDGRDQDGDEVANGVYLYRVRAASAGRSSEAIGKIMLIRTNDPLRPKTR